MKSRNNPANLFSCRFLDPMQLALCLHLTQCNAAPAGVDGAPVMQHCSVASSVYVFHNTQVQL